MFYGFASQAMAAGTVVSRTLSIGTNDVVIGETNIIVNGTVTATKIVGTLTDTNKVDQSQLIAALEGKLTNETDTLQIVVTRQAGVPVTNLPALASETWAIGSDGRMVRGRYLSLANIAESAYGAQQEGLNNPGGIQTIDEMAFGARQSGNNSSIGRQTIGSNAYGSIQNGFNEGVQTIGDFAYGSQQSGNNYGFQTIDNNVMGSLQSGYNIGTQTLSEYTYGAQQIGRNDGTQTIGYNAYGVMQIGYNYGTQTMGNSPHGSIQNGYNYGTQTIGDNVYGAQQNGCNLGTQNIGESAHGAQQSSYNTGTQTILADAVGARQTGRNSGTQTIESNAFSAQQHGYNSGTQTISDNAAGAIQNGYNYGTQTIGDNAVGSQQSGYNVGTQTIGESIYGAQQNGFVLSSSTQTIGEGAHGAQQRGYMQSNTSATNNGRGAIQLFDLTAGQAALTTTDGKASLLLGAGVASNKNAIVAGDGQVSHGDGSITAGGGFYGESVWPSNRYEDLVVYPAGMNLTGAPNAADLAVDSGPSSDMIALRFPASGTSVAGGAFQMPHSWNAGTRVYPHIHMHHNTTAIGTSVWQVVYSFGEIGASFPASTTVTVTNVCTTNKQWIQQLVNLPTAGVDGTGKTRSAILRWRVSRLGDNAADNYSGDIDVVATDLHYQSRGTPVLFNP
jgi:hypothetical protein